VSNLNQLERDWKAYKIRERRPLIITFIVVVPIILGLGLFLIKDEPKKHITSKKSSAIAVPVIKQELPKKIVVIESNKTQPVHLKEKLPPKAQELRPSFTFMKHIKETKHTKRKKPIKHKTKKHTYKKTTKTEKTYENYASHHKVAVSSASVRNKIDALAKRFNSNRNPILGIAVAKQYLKSKQYKQAYFYALEVNNIDRRNEESWLVSAQALYHLKDKKAALKLLKIYLHKNSSSNAQRLYQAIKQGRLK